MKLILILIVMVATSCATSHGGCNYAKAQKYNAKQMKKAHRYYASRR